MIRHPEQDRALAYLHRKGADAPVENVRAKVAWTLGRLEKVLREISPELATRKPDARTWCIQEVVNHLTVSLEPGIEQLEALIAGRSPGEAIPASLLDPEALSVSWPAACERLEAAHARYLATVDRAVAADTPLDRTVPTLMLIKVEDGSGDRVPLEWIEQLDWKSSVMVAHVHTYEHLDQIRRILERVS